VRKTSKGWEGVSRHFRENVVEFSRAVVRAESSQIRKIAGMAGGRVDSQRRRLQRFVQQEQALPPFFKNWTRSVVKALGTRSVVLVVDESKIKAQFGVMAVGLAYEGRGIPLAWRMYQANNRAAYPSEGQAQMIISLLQQVANGMPRGTTVRVLADRGIGTSPAHMRGVMALGWHFLFRVTKQSKIVLEDGQALTFHDQVTQPGQRYAASGLVFKRRGRVPAHVRVLWGERAQAPWSLVTHDPRLDGSEYGQRMWIEELFRDLKSHGWDIENTYFTDPQRVARLWIFLVVAYAWMLLWGLQQLAWGLTTALKRRADGSRVRRCSLFREGRQAFLALAPPS